MKTCSILISMLLKHGNQYLGDNPKTNDKRNPLYKV